MTTPASAIKTGAPESQLSGVLERFRQLFNELSKDNLDRLRQVYGDDIVFEDPFRRVTGLEQLTEYLAGAYGNVIRCRFRFGEPVLQQHRCALPWVMELEHKRIRGGQPVLVDGLSHLEIRNGKVRYHRDYFDAGQLLYENLPVLGGVIRWAKGKAG
ncbi:nuclear transport factor 2 family protein [Marinobacter lutaoensis]|uniref:Transcriptional regulator n=1 Tax=Marinobacter lutaoensis TaxID=135739 RepID=A0A1V2DV61_9GAMM|nr:nuclear transport factor 2 family protein [Marinobacter lutaoensis]NVD35203.1 nuclear transport factor 2 family protein [Marinobacter lutaoensis]ONF44161.1 transcriptional regulator [Marinobacter lutaoensis]